MEEDTGLEGTDVIEGWERYSHKGMCTSHSNLCNVLF
jgi:hypothetical protein